MRARAKEIVKKYFPKNAEAEPGTTEVITLFFDEAKLEASKMATPEEAMDVWRHWGQKWLNVTWTSKYVRLDKDAFTNKVKLVYPNLHKQLGWP